MASKKFLFQLDIQVSSVFTTVTTGFVGFAAKADGLYQKIGSNAETRLVTLNDVGTYVAPNAHNHSALYAPIATVSFPGFGTSHALAAYGDHTHDLSGYSPTNHNHTGVYAPASTVSFPGFGTTVGKACEGNDTRLSNSRPASDVYAWAKALEKPTYTYTEVGAAASVHSHSGIYAPIGTVSFPGFGTSHALAAYGDHTHDLSGYSPSNHTHSNYALINGSSDQHFFTSEFIVADTIHLKKTGTSFEIWHSSGAGFLFDTSGVIHAEDFANDSDVSLKQNIKPISAKLDVNFVEFTMIADETNRQKYGVLAQELELIAPELVYTKSNGKKSVAYIQLLVAKVAELERRLKELEDE